MAEFVNDKRLSHVPGPIYATPAKDRTQYPKWSVGKERRFAGRSVGTPGPGAYREATFTDAGPKFTTRVKPFIDPFKCIEPLNCDNFEFIFVECLITSVWKTALALLLPSSPGFKQCLHLPIRLYPLCLLHHGRFRIVLCLQLVQPAAQALIFFQEAFVGLLDVLEPL